MKLHGLSQSSFSSHIKCNLERAYQNTSKSKISRDVGLLFKGNSSSIFSVQVLGEERKLT